MRKRIIAGADARPPEGQTRLDESAWLDVERVAVVELSSEDPAHPIEAALAEGPSTGWRAGAPGPQTVRFRFDAPTRLRRILIEVREDAVERTQELAIACAATDGGTREVLRQRWNFSPHGSTREVEDWRVDLHGVTDLTITIQPDVAGGDAVASIAKLRIA